MLLVDLLAVLWKGYGDLARIMQWAEVMIKLCQDWAFFFFFFRMRCSLLILTSLYVCVCELYTRLQSLIFMEIAWKTFVAL